MSFIHCRRYTKIFQLITAAALSCCLAAAGGFSVFAAEPAESSSKSSPSQPQTIRLGEEPEGGESSAQKLIPPLVEAGPYRDRMKVRWIDLNPSSSGYLLEIKSGGKVIEQRQFSKYETSYYTDYQAKDGALYTFKLKALGTEDYGDSGFASAQYLAGSEKIDRPRGLELKVEDEHFLASWDESESAGAYRFVLLDPKGKVLTDSTSSKSYYHLDDIPVREKGMYVMYVQAQEGKMGSEFVRFCRQVDSRYEQVDSPVILKTKFLDGKTLEVEWSEAEHAQSYTIRLRTYGENHKYLSESITTTDISYTFKDIDFQKHRRYVIEIRSNAERGYASSGFDAVTTDYYI